MSERSGAREQSEQCGASERVSGASERANGQASGPVLTSRFLAVLTYCAPVGQFIGNTYTFLALSGHLMHHSPCPSAVQHAPKSAVHPALFSSQGRLTSPQSQLRWTFSSPAPPVELLFRPSHPHTNSSNSSFGFFLRKDDFKARV